MPVELGDISRLYGGNACLISSRTVQINGILQYISAFPHLIDEEFDGSILVHLIISDAAVPVIT